MIRQPRDHAIDETIPEDRHNGLRVATLAILVAIFWTGLIGWTVSECKGLGIEEME